MKSFISLLVLIFSFNVYSATTFEAIVIKDLNQLSISISDDSLFPPYEAGEFWKAMMGEEQRKYIDVDGFSMECDGIRQNTFDVYGSCTFNIPMVKFQKVGDIQVYKLKGIAAARLNKYFTDSAYVSVQGGSVYLSSYNTRREFYFGIKDSLIKR